MTTHTYMTNGRVFAAAVDEAAFLPNGRAVSLETAEEMGFEECEAAPLTDACTAAVAAHVALLDNAEAARGGGDTAYNVREPGAISRLRYRRGVLVGWRVWR